MSQTLRLFLMAVLVSMTLVTGCTTNSSTAPQENAQSAPEEGAGKQDLIMWVDSELLAVAEVIAQQYLEDTGASLKVVERTLEEISAGRATENPDLFIGSHEWIEPLSVEGALLELDPSLATDFQPSSVLAMSQAGELYGIPYAIESLALVCDGTRVTEQPQNYADLVAIGYKTVLSPGGDPYALFGLQSSFSVLPLQRDEHGDWLTSSGFDLSQAITFGSWLKDQRGDFIELDYSAGVTAFLDGTLPCLYTGPWSLALIREAASFDLEVFAFPQVDIEPALSFANVKGLFASSTADPESVGAIAEYFAAAATQELIYLETGRTPVKKSVIPSVDDPLLRGFANAAEYSIPLPEAEKMIAVWGPWGQAMRQIIFAESDPNQAWSELLAQLGGS